MKCRMCNGTGKTEGYFQESTEMKGIYKQVNVTIKCNNCNGTGEVEQTNEEWFCSLSTEEKAEWLSNRDEFIYDCGQRSVTPKIMDKDEWDVWLKAVHEE